MLCGRYFSTHGIAALTLAAVADEG